MLAPPGGKSSIGFGEEVTVKAAPKNAASAQKAKDLSTNFMAPVETTEKAAAPQKEGEAAVSASPEAPRPRGAPNRARAPPGGHSAGSFW